MARTKQTVTQPVRLRKSAQLRLAARPPLDIKAPRLLAPLPTAIMLNKVTDDSSSDSEFNEPSTEDSESEKK